MSAQENYDVIIVGGGNAALCAALSAREEGAQVLLLERAPEDERGGNSSFTEGLMRFVYNGADDIKALSPDLTDEEMKSDFGTYTEEKFFDDMARITQNRTDPDLCEIVVRNSNAIMHWMREKGIRFLPSSAGSRSRSTANSRSGAGQPSRRWEEGEDWSTACIGPPKARE